MGFKDLSVDAVKWQWRFDESKSDENQSTLQHPSHTYADTGNYCPVLIVRSSAGCIDSTYRCLRVEPEFAFYIPNAFSPNNDGINDAFTGKGLGIAKFQLDIFDRWGHLIYESKELSNPWDGRSNYGDKIVQQDVYVYTISIIDVFTNPHNYIGHVTVVK